MGFGASTIVGNLMVDLVQADVDGIVNGIGGNADLNDLDQDLGSILGQLNKSSYGALYDGSYGVADYLYMLYQQLDGAYQSVFKKSGDYSLIEYVSGQSYVGPLYQMEQYISGSYTGPFYDGSYNLVGYLSMIYSTLSSIYGYVSGLTYDGSGNLNVKSN